MNLKTQHSHLRHTELIDRTPEWIGPERTWELESTLIRSLFKAFQKIGVRFYYWTTVDLPPQYNLEEFSTSKLIFDDFKITLHGFKIKKNYIMITI